MLVVKVPQKLTHAWIEPPEVNLWQKKLLQCQFFFLLFGPKTFFRQNALPAQKVLKENPLQIRQLQQLKVGYAQHQNGLTSNSFMYLTGQRLISNQF